MISHSLLAQFCNDIYDDSKRSSWLHYWEDDDIHVAHINIDGTDIIIFRGSVDVNDWIDNCDFVPTFCGNLGWVHRGFYEDMEKVLQRITPILGSKVVITGHSLGGARARILTALMIDKKYPVSQLTVFGSPRPAFKAFSQLIKNSGVIHTSYRNGEDPVTEVPHILPFWTHPDEYICLNEKPTNDELAEIIYHSMELYLSGVKKLYPLP